ncbi:hypothetical protein OSB04_013997 [Centaurea solstitialis]|uniref:non-specific serine/threonine protein kinase n=1 Tax=Centaurea solstitialis TaxID=347529 RepID=A0AA38TLV1_9ASTR|nr:hypothetical protein OSB04_013997 [Centaurea solstitialis]
MALVLVHFLFLTIFISCVGAQQTNCSASVGASLTATDDVKPWLSPSGDFAFGFQRIQGKDNFVLSIWYDKIPDKTIIWYPQTNSTVSRGSKVELTNRRGLVLKDPQGREVWSTSIPVSDLTCGFMNDTGNFVILGNNSGKIWESFKSPADTILPTQVLELQGEINSRKNKTDFSLGRFVLLMRDDGNLVIRPRDISSTLPLYAYYFSDPNVIMNSTISGERLVFDSTGYLYILRRNGTRSNLTTTGTLPSGDYYHRATLDSDGVFTQYYYPKNPAANASWEDIWFVPLPKDICLSLQPSSGVCGRNSVCSVNGKRPKCECPQGFSLVDSNDPIGDCKPDFTPTCYEGYAGDQFDFIKLDNINWPGSDYANILSTNEQTCQISCKEDCLCAVALFAGGQCWKKALPLTNGRKVTDSIKVFVKYQKHDRPPQCPPPFSKEKCRRSSLVLVGSILLSTSVFVIAVLTGLICVGFFPIAKKKPTIHNPSSKSVETNLPRFTYQELVEATNGFEDELGRGAFGVVYKGVIGENTVAVKKLNRVVQDGEKEFQTEVNAIARTHHKNLVQLRGYCDDGEQRLLSYEYMNNGTLAAFLFGEMKPSWKQRSYIAVGVAKGLAYLHEECSTQIIHCDIKPQNILLDEYYNAKISDFGLAKLLMLNQSHTNTGIRGTKGYVAPEWFRNAPVTVKVDVYSFGVLLLEIVSCRKSVKEYEIDDENEAVILTDWVWDCYQEKGLDLVVEDDSEALDDVKKVTTFVKVGLWCVQENPSLRPTMREVVQMLEGVVEVKEPPCAQQTNCSASVGASLTAYTDVEPWLSPSGDFAFGFQQLQGNDKFLLSIWYDKIPDKTIIWYPQTNSTASRGSKVELINQRGLVLKDPQGREVWSTSTSVSDVACGFMNDTGNFVILGNNSGNIWESFKSPADTILPTQVLEIEGEINSRKSKTDFSHGRFQVRMLPSGNLVLNTRDLFIMVPLDAYYISGTSDAENSTNSGYKLIFDAMGYLSILRRNGERFDLTTRGTLPSGDYYHRATLDSDGVFTQYYYPKNPTGNASWEDIWFVPNDICLSFNRGSGVCGRNNVCSLDGKRPKCECPQGFSLVDSNDPIGDCKPDFTPTCYEGYAGDQFDFIELNSTNWPESDYAHIGPTNEEDCKISCREDCLCAVAIFGPDQCWKKALPLSNGRKTNEYVKTFLKYQKVQLPPPPTSRPWFSKENEDNDQRSLILVGAVLISTLVFVIFILISVGFFSIYKKKPTIPNPSSKSLATNLPRFTYQELVEATNGFEDELGRGAFGIVYKGVIGENTVAVKKLNRVVQDGEKEFQTEVNAIARTHHKNLVQLLGYCDDGEQRLLVYEYMNNGTLAAFLFGEMKPNWKQRSYIAVGIAKGLAYLHEECSTQIIHCDIKPQNILLDEYYNAKISDFGLAKLLILDQSHTNTGIRGTKGYVAPEWFRNAPVTVKVDVYSFGVLLLEIVSCRKTVKEYKSGDENGAVILTDWAWDCYQERRLDLVVEGDLEALDDVKKLTTFVKVGLWCVQENPGLRPTMKEVVQMLEGVVEVKEPPCPFPFSVTYN